MKSILEFMQTKHINVDSKLTGETINFNDTESMQEGTYFKETFKSGPDTVSVYGVLKRVEQVYNGYYLHYYVGVTGSEVVKEDDSFGFYEANSKLTVMNKEDYEYFTDMLDKNDINIPEKFKL